MRTVLTPGKTKKKTKETNFQTGYTKCQNNVDKLQG